MGTADPMDPANWGHPCENQIPSIERKIAEQNALIAKIRDELQRYENEIDEANTALAACASHELLPAGR